ncbi:MAG TPA: glycosyl hydrolase, partial [Thermomicrobiales bacterium]|nr:glycosyl hydrolase [Thermomicrobiales bacterium]
TDGGKNWELILHRGPRAGAIDIALDPHNPRLLYAAFWQAQRYPYALHSGGDDAGIWRSRDGGDTWEEITRNKGLPTGTLGKIGIAASPAQPGRVWALIEAEDGALFRSDDFGATWERVCENGDLRRRPWYYMHVFADPQDADTVWVLNLNCWKSVDGGRNFEAIPTPHGDNHGLWIDPRDSNRMIEGHDGGACVTFDGGRSWSSVLNQPTAQFYHVTTDDRVPYGVYGSQQDNWAMRLPSIGFEGAISWKDYVEPGGGESGYIAVSPKPPHKVFGGGIGTGPGHGRLIAWNPETGQKRNVTVWPEVHGFGAGTDQHKYRFQWTFPVEFSPHNPDVLYVTSNHVHRSTDEGHSWTVISPDLTRNDKEKQVSNGGPITADNSGAEIYCTIFAFRESPHEAGVFWAGSDDGLIHLSRDNGQTWENVTPRDLPEWALISIIEPSPHDAATAYVAATRYKQDDLHPYLYKTTDYGQTWTPIVHGIPDDDFTRTIRADPERKGLLFAGTETGIYVSFDDGAAWERLQGNLPVVPIYDLVVKGSDLVVATHGRSFWILDDISLLRQVRDGAASGPVHLFTPRPTTRFKIYGRGNAKPGSARVNYKMTGPVTVGYRLVDNAQGNNTEQFLDAGANPPDGAIIHYAFATAPEGAVTLEILDKGGNVVRRFTSTSEDAPRVPVAVGANRFIWDLRYERAAKLEDQTKKDPRSQAGEDNSGPRAVPGEYQVRLTANGASQTVPLTILQDPRLPITVADLQAQFDLKLKVRDTLSAVHDTVNQLRRLRGQVESWAGRAGDEHADVKQQADSLKEKLTAIESALIITEPDKPQPGPAKLKEKLATLSAMIEEADDRPTAAAEEVYADLAQRVAAEQERLRQLVSDDVARFNDAVRAAALPAVG